MEKSLVMDLNAAMPTRAKQAIDAVQAERLSPETPRVGVEDAIVRAHGKMNRERLAEMTSPASAALARNKQVDVLLGFGSLWHDKAAVRVLGA
jgi:hypothetical protein